MTGPALFRKQKGVALFIALIALVVLMIAAIALVRSTDTAQLISGNLAVKRDLTHESELALQAALANFNGALAGEGARWTDLASANYSASVLASNNQGIPTALSTAPLTGEAASPYTPGVTYRYVIDRMCPNPGPASNQNCITGNTVANVGGNARNPTYNAGSGVPNADGTVVYRISARMTDARQTQTFVQTTLQSYGGGG